MQFLTTVLAIASLAIGATAAPVEERAAASPCLSNQSLTYNTGQIPGSGGWTCVTDLNGGCSAYYWTTTLPYYSCT